MKILFVTDLYPIIKDNSIPKIIEDFALGLKEFGYEIEILRGNFLINTLIRRHKIIKNGIFEKNGIKIYNKNFILPFISFINNDNSKFKIENYDLIISHMPSGHLLADLINKKQNLAHISIVHQSDWNILNNFIYKFYFKKRLIKTLKNSNLIGARNTDLAKKFNTNFVLPSFVEKEKIINSKEFNKEKIKIITLSKLIKRKNIDKVIFALAKADFDFEYSIYGEGKEKIKLEKLIKYLNLENKIKIFPHIEHSKIWEKLDENNVFILPSINESFGISYLEAMARGLITIGTINTGIDGIIKNNENGYLIEPKIDSIKAILEKIKHENQDKIIENTLTSIQNYTKEKIIKNYDEIIKKIL